VQHHELVKRPIETPKIFISIAGDIRSEQPATRVCIGPGVGKFLDQRRRFTMRATIQQMKTAARGLKRKWLVQPRLKFTVANIFPIVSLLRHKSVIFTAHECELKFFAETPKSIRPQENIIRIHSSPLNYFLGTIPGVLACVRALANIVMRARLVPGC
jgi:hypothetical protein